MKQITIYDLLPLLKNGYVACNKKGMWRYFTKKPYAVVKTGWWVAEYGDIGASKYLDMFNLKPFDGDWKDSLIKVEHMCSSKCSSKCASSGQVKEYIIHIEEFAPPHPTGFMSESQLKRMFEHKEEE